MKLSGISKTLLLAMGILFLIVSASQATPIATGDIKNLGNNFWKMDVTVAEGSTPVQGVCVWCTSQISFAAPQGNKFKCAITDSNGATQYIFVGLEGADYSAGWTFTVSGCSDFCCCEIPEDPFEQGCLTLVCSETNQSLCELSLGGIWNSFSKCNLSLGNCEAYTAITLARFDAAAGFKKTILNWATETEIDNIGFNLYRAEAADGMYEKINSAIIAANGSATQGAVYSFTDSELKNGKTYYYKLEDIDLNGTSTMHGPVSATPRLFYWTGK
jgi:hypothetical protein